MNFREAPTTRRATSLLILGLVFVSILALSSTLNFGPSGVTNETLTTPALQTPVTVSGDLAGVGPFNYTYCGPECQSARAQSAASATSRTCAATMDPLQCYTFTHTNSNFCVALCQTTTTYVTGGSTVTSTIEAWHTSATGTGSTSSFCGYYCQYTRTHGATTGTTSITTHPPSGAPAQIALILARFSDVPPNRTAQDIAGEWNTDVVDYYQHVSHGAFAPFADVYGWITLPNNEAYYGADCGGNLDSGIACNTFPYSWSLARDAVSLAEYNGANLTQYKHLIVIHSGNGQESDGPAYPNSVWSVTYYSAPAAGSPDQGVFTSFSIVPETERHAVALGIWCAEFGHQQGFAPIYWPDMFYATEYTVAKTGRWELESIGTWNGSPHGSTPAFTLTINQVNAHWLYDGHGFVQVYTQATHGIGNGTATIQLSEVELDQGNMSIEVITTGHHFYWIEARRQTSWDSGIPMNGVLIGSINHSVGWDSSAFFLLNADPSDLTLNHAAFQVGQTYKDAWVTITIESYSNGTYSVNIT